MAHPDFKVIKVTSDSFNGPRYYSHINCVGFAFVPMEGDNFKRNLLKFNPTKLYDQKSLTDSMAKIQKEYPGHTVTAIDLASLEPSL